MRYLSEMEIAACCICVVVIGAIVIAYIGWVVAPDDIMKEVCGYLKMTDGEYKEVYYDKFGECPHVVSNDE